MELDVLDVGIAHPVAQTDLCDAEIRGGSLDGLGGFWVAATSTTTGETPGGSVLGNVSIHPAARHGVTDQLSHIRTAVQKRR